MPPLEEPVQLPGAFTADFNVARTLLTKARTYEQPVKAFEPYQAVQEPNDGARAALRTIAEDGLKRKAPTLPFVNNRLEGNSPATIEVLIGGLQPACWGRDFPARSARSPR